MCCSFVHDVYLIPEALDLEALLEAAGFASWLRPIRLRKLYWFLDFLVEGQFIRRRYPWEKFVNIPSTLLGRELGTRFYHDVIGVLIQLGIIQRNRCYSNREFDPFCKSYRYTPRYCAGIRIAESARLSQMAVPLKDSSVLTNETERFIFNNIRRLEIDRGRFSAVDLDLRLRDPSRQARLRKSALCIDNGIVNFHSGRSQRRVYNTPTNAPRELRSCLCLGIESLVEYDLQATQPTLLLSLYPDLSCDEALRYMRCLEGDIYTGLLNEAKGRRVIPDSRCLGRDEMKVEFLYHAFGKRKRLNTFGKCFAGMFPELHQRIAETCGRCLSIRLQDLEAQIMIYGAVERCRKEGLFIVPIHDGFLARPGDAAQISGFLRDEFISRFSFCPKINDKTVSPMALAA